MILHKDPVTGAIRDAGIVSSADTLIKLKRENQTDIWVVIDKIIEVWANTHPTKWDAYLIDLAEIKDSLYDKKFATARKTHTKGTGNIRQLLDIPEPIVRMIRALYNPIELPMNKEFYAGFAKRYKKFVVADKL